MVVLMEESMPKDAKNATGKGQSVAELNETIETLSTELKKSQDVVEALRLELATYRAAHERVQGELCLSKTETRVLDKVVDKFIASRPR